MKYCKTCYKTVCRCGDSKEEVDYYIYPALYEFTRKGYRIKECMSGDPTNSSLETRINLEKDAKFKIKSDYVQFEEYKYNGHHVRKNTIVPTPDVKKSFQKKRTDKVKLIQDICRDLYRIACDVPTLVENKRIGEFVFPQDYFENESFTQMITDLQKPWMLVLPKYGNCKEFLEEFYGLADNRSIMYAFVISQSGVTNRYFTHDFSSTSENAMQSKLAFDISSIPRLMQFGVDKEMQIEESSLGTPVKWHLSYVVMRDTEYDLYYNNSAPLDVMTDISDYLDDNEGTDLISAMGKGFDYLNEKNVNICAFSSDNILIIFSNRIDFAFEGSKNGTGVIFGPIDYDECNYKHITVTGREYFIFSDGAILLRKELENHAD